MAKTHHLRGFRATLVRRLGFGRHVLFYNRFVDLDELRLFIEACDVYVIPYLSTEQVVSRILAGRF